MKLRAVTLALLLGCTAPPPAPTPTPAAPPPPPAPPVAITVSVDWPGASPADVEQNITTPLEQALHDLRSLTAIDSASRSGRSELELTFRPGTDLFATRSLVQSRLQAALRDLPDSVSHPQLGRGHTPHPAILFTLQSASLSADELGQVTDKIRDSLAATPGVTEVDLCGRHTPRLEISLAPERLSARGIATSTLVDAVRASSAALPLSAGLHTDPELRSLEDLTDLTITAAPAPIRLRDVAELRRTATLDTCAAIRVGDRPLVIGVVHAQNTAAEADFTRDVNATLATQRVDLQARGIDLAVPTVPPLRASIDLTAPADPSTTLLDTAATFHQQLTAAGLNNTAYLQAPLTSLPGERVLGDLLLLLDAPEHAAAVRQRLATLPSIRAIGSVADPDDDPQRRRVWVTGPDLEILARTAERLSTLLRTTPGVTRALTRDIRTAELTLKIDRTKLSQLNLSPGTVQTTLSAALGDAPVTTLRDGAAILPVHLHLPVDAAPGHARRIAQLRAITLQPPAGAPVPLDSVLQVRADEQPAAILHHDRQRAALVEFFSSVPSNREATIKKIAAEIELPVGVAVVWESR